MAVVHRNHRINNRYFDSYLPDYNLIIERDGEQRYYEPFKIVGSRMKNIDRTLKFRRRTYIRMEIIEILRNNPFSHIKEKGRGWSYSMNKINSIFVKL